MEIKRIINGKEIKTELSETELRLAYKEQEHRHDVQGIKAILENYDPEITFDILGLSINELLEHVDEIADKTRRDMDKYDIPLHYAAIPAINKIGYMYGKEKYKK